MAVIQLNGSEINFFMMETVRTNAFSHQRANFGYQKFPPFCWVKRAAKQQLLLSVLMEVGHQVNLNFISV